MEEEAALIILLQIMQGGRKGLGISIFETT